MDESYIDAFKYEIKRKADFMGKQKEIIAIIGGGSIGISFLIQLIDEAIEANATNKFEILLFEPQETVGPGYAYQADYSCNLLNTAADTMSAKRNEKNDFIQWLIRNETVWRECYPNIELKTDAYLPRGLFGIYLNSKYQQVIETIKKANIPFRHIKDKVVDIECVSLDKNIVETKFSGKFIVDRLVFCIGNMPSEKFRELNEFQGYFNSVYPCNLVTKMIPSDSSVCIIGTSLSSIDMIVSLKEAGHSGEIVCVSRNGRLPSVRGKMNKKHILSKIVKNRIDQLVESRSGILSLKKILEVLIEEYENVVGEKCNINDILNINVCPKDYISTEIQLSKDVDRVWQSIIYSTNEIIDYVWHKLSSSDKRVFDRYFRSLWLAYRVSFPLDNALKIQELLRIGQLRIVGGIKSISYDKNERIFSISVAEKGTGLRSIIQSEYLVNATSYSVDVTASEDPLVKNLLKRGYAMPHEFGGFFVDYDTGALVETSGKINDRMTMLGSLTCGTYLWTNAMDVNVRLAGMQAKRLILSLEEESFDYSKFNSEMFNDLDVREVITAQNARYYRFNEVQKFV